MPSLSAQYSTDSCEAVSTEKSLRKQATAHRAREKLYHFNCNLFAGWMALFLPGFGHTWQQLVFCSCSIALPQLPRQSLQAWCRAAKYRSSAEILMAVALNTDEP